MAVKASLIIPTFSKLPRLRFVLRSLLQLEEKDLFEIIIVDDGSTDGTELLLETFKNEAMRVNLRFTVERIPNSGRSVARNQGVSVAKGEILIFSDDDLILSPGFVKEHVESHQEGCNRIVRGAIYDLPFLKFFKDPETGELFDPDQGLGKGLLSRRIRLDIIEPSLRLIRSQARFSKFEKDIHQLYAITSPDHELRWIGCTGGNFSVKKDHFEQAGGFDPHLGRGWGCEDLELGYRLKDPGTDFLIAWKAENFHMSHFRVNAGDEHHHAMAYFIAQHPVPAVSTLGLYFQGVVSSLVEWKTLLESMEKGNE